MKPANIGRFFHHLKAKYHYSCFSLLPEIFMSIKKRHMFPYAVSAWFPVQQENPT